MKSQAEPHRSSQGYSLGGTAAVTAQLTLKGIFTHLHKFDQSHHQHHPLFLAGSGSSQGHNQADRKPVVLFCESAAGASRGGLSDLLLPGRKGPSFRKKISFVWEKPPRGERRRHQQPVLRSLKNRHQNSRRPIEGPRGRSPLKTLKADRSLITQAGTRV